MAHIALGDALQKRGHDAAATEAYRQILQRERRNVLFHNKLAATLRKLGRLEEAIDALQELLKLEPAKPEARRALDLALQERSRLTGR